MVLQYRVPDMSCDHCVKVITRAVTEAVPGTVVQADLANHAVTVTGTDDRAPVERAIRAAGYTPVAA
jgi:copper chaperone